jgi:hypothetical protein
MKHTERNYWPAVAAAAALLLLVAPLAFAYVNPNFTPKHVENQSKLICTLRVASIAADGRSAKLDVAAVIKGKAGVKKLKLSFAQALGARDGKKNVKDVIDLLKAAGKRPALLAAGEFQGREGGLLHVEATWVRLAKDKAGNWQVEKIDSDLAGTFNGGTDMLIETMRFIRKFPDAPIMPVAGGVKWSEHSELGKLPGKASALMAVDVNGDDKPDVFACCAAGDRLFLNKGEARFEAGKETGSASLAAAWADFDGDGRVDLASLGKKGLTLYLQREAGKFTGRGVKPAGKFGTDSPTVYAVDLGGDGRADLVAGIGYRPVVLRNKDGKGTFEAVKLRDPWNVKDMIVPPGKAGPCVAADFDGDGLVDLLQLHQKRALFWRGKADGSFEDVDCPSASMGEAKWRRPYVADLDGDGRLDVWLIGGGKGPGLLQNRGGGKFEEVMRMTGEPHYNIQAGATCGALGDYNNDTFVDMLAGYAEGKTQTFFNRGFRSFAIDEAVGLKKDDVAGAEKGQAAALWADLDNTGSLELVSALAGGKVYMSMTDVGEMDDPRCVMVKVSPKAKLAGPVVARFYLEGRCLGARTAGRWTGPALLGAPEPGDYQVRYRLPDGREYARTLELEEGAASFSVGEKDREYRPGKGAK